MFPQMEDGLPREGAEGTAKCRTVASGAMGPDVVMVIEGHVTTATDNQGNLLDSGTDQLSSTRSEARRARLLGAVEVDPFIYSPGGLGHWFSRQLRNRDRNGSFPRFLSKDCERVTNWGVDTTSGGSWGAFSTVLRATEMSCKLCSGREAPFTNSAADSCIITEWVVEAVDFQISGGTKTEFAIGTKAVAFH